MKRWMAYLAAGTVSLAMLPAFGNAQEGGQGEMLRKRDGSCLVDPGTTDQAAAGQGQQLRLRKRDGTGPGCMYGMYGLPQCWWFMGSATAATDQNTPAQGQQQRLRKRDGTGPGYGWGRGGGGGRGWRGGRGGSAGGGNQ